MYIDIVLSMLTFHENNGFSKAKECDCKHWKLAYLQIPIGAHFWQE